MGSRQGKTEVRAALFADDILLFTSNPRHGVIEVQNIFKIYGRFAGLKIYFNKSEVLLLIKTAQGDWLSRTPLKQVGVSIKYLEVNIGKEPASLYTLNYPPLIDRIIKKLEMWANLPLSLMGRAHLFKMVSFSRLQTLQTLPIMLQHKHVNGLNEALKKYLWKGKRHRINMQKLYLPKGRGFRTYAIIT